MAVGFESREFVVIDVVAFRVEVEVRLTSAD